MEPIPSFYNQCVDCNFARAITTTVSTNRAIVCIWKGARGAKHAIYTENRKITIKSAQIYELSKVTRFKTEEKIISYNILIDVKKSSRTTVRSRKHECTQ